MITRHFSDSITISCEQRNVTGSCNFVTYRDTFGEKKQFMVDCGIFQGIDEPDAANDGFTVLKDFSKLSAIFVTHSHSDHIGRLVLAYKHGFRGKIYCTKQTAMAIPPVLEDIYKISKIRWKKMGVRKFYTSEDIKETIKLICIVQPYNIVKLDDSVRAIFWLNAHLPGSAGIRFKINGINLFFTGDYKEETVFFKSRKLPESWRKQPVTVITESTYGDQISQQVEESILEKNIMEAMSSKKLMIIFALSQGRTEDVLYKITRMQKHKKLDSDIQIFLDGKLSRKFFYIWNSREFELNRDFIPENLYMVEGEEHRNSIIQNQLSSSSTTPVIIITSSGMGSYGPAQEYISQLLREGKAYCQFTSYLPEGTAARALVDAKEQQLETFEMFGRYFQTPICEVKTTTESSGHARADSLVRHLLQVGETRHVLVTHGSSVKRLAFTNYAQREFEKQGYAVPEFINFTAGTIVRIYADGRLKIIQ